MRSKLTIICTQSHYTLQGSTNNLLASACGFTHVISKKFICNIWALFVIVDIHASTYSLILLKTVYTIESEVTKIPTYLLYIYILEW